MDDIDLMFAALADPTRRRIVELLRERPLRAGEVAERLRVSRPIVSRHLRALRSRGVVDVREEDGRARLYICAPTASRRSRRGSQRPRPRPRWRSHLAARARP